MAVADVWLEGEHPDTKLVVVVTIDSSPGCRFVHRGNLWHPGTDSDPEQNAAHVDVEIEEWTAGLRGRRQPEPGWTYEPRPPAAGATQRRPDLEALVRPSLSGDDDGGRAELPWPRPPESDPDGYERCLLALFAGEWPGYRMHIEDAWLEGEHPDTNIVLLLRMSDMPIPRGVFRTGIWRSPGAPSAAWSPADIAAGLMREWHLAVGEVTRDPGGTYEPRLAQPGAQPRRPKLG